MNDTVLSNIVYILIGVGFTLFIKWQRNHPNRSVIVLYMMKNKAGYRYWKSRYWENPKKRASYRMYCVGNYNLLLTVIWLLFLGINFYYDFEIIVGAMLVSFVLFDIFEAMSPKNLKEKRESFFKSAFKSTMERLEKSGGLIVYDSVRDNPYTVYGNYKDIIYFDKVIITDLISKKYSLCCRIGRNNEIFIFEKTTSQEERM